MKDLRFTADCTCTEVNYISPPTTSLDFNSFLKENYCNETLGFLAEAVSYQTSYEDYSAREFLPEYEQQAHSLRQSWHEMMELYVRNGSINEINITGNVRKALLAIHFDVDHPVPSPELLIVAHQHLTELLYGVYVQWAADHQVRAKVAMVEHAVNVHEKKRRQVTTFVRQLSRRLSG